jgi:hypothetical protein
MIYALIIAFAGMTHPVEHHYATKADCEYAQTEFWKQVDPMADALAVCVRIENPVEAKP